MPKYPGSNQAALLNANTQKFLWNGEPATQGQASIAVLLERQKSNFYPWGFAMEFIFSGAPGTFEIDVQGAETDIDAAYCTIGTAVTAVNSSQACRFDSTAQYPKYVRALLKTVTNSVNITAKVTR